VVAGTGLCEGFVDGTKREHYGKQKEQFCDPRDGKKYVYVEIGSQTWMAENLNYATYGGYCVADSGRPTNNNTIYCDTYGRFYDWVTAMDYCPSGWHLPSTDEWNTLINFFGGSKIAGKKLKTTSGWTYGNGTDDLGFSALPGELGTYDGGFGAFGSSGYWWSSEDGNMGGGAFCPSIGGESASINICTKSYLVNVRCLKD
jgi:uncharacterized protein (TIGR02145 family)